MHLSDLTPIPKQQTIPLADISQLAFLANLGGRGCTKKVRLPHGTESSPQYVFKGVDFQTYLQVHDDDDKFAVALVEAWRRSSKLIATTQPHAHIQPPLEILVFSHEETETGTDQVFVGHLSRFLHNGDLAAAIEAANATDTTISLRQKATWCLHMAKAIEHTHNEMHTYHMDIKPGNFLIDDSGGLILIDWEQSGAPPTTLAPEADGTWDVSLADSTDAHLVFTKYTGPERRNIQRVAA